MAYELLSKRLPFAEPPILLLLSPKITEPPTPLAQLCPELNALVASMLDRCLQIHPEDRPSSRELAEAGSPVCRHRRQIAPAAQGPSAPPDAQAAHSATLYSMPTLCPRNSPPRVAGGRPKLGCCGLRSRW